MDKEKLKEKYNRYFGIYPFVDELNFYHKQLQLAVKEAKMTKEEINIIKQIITMILYQQEFPHYAKLVLIKIAKKAGIDFRE